MREVLRGEGRILDTIVITVDGEGWLGVLCLRGLDVRRVVVGLDLVLAWAPLDEVYHSVPLQVGAYRVLLFVGLMGLKPVPLICHSSILKLKFNFTQ